MCQDCPGLRDNIGELNSSGPMVRKAPKTKGIEKRATAVSMALAKPYQASSALSLSGRSCGKYQRVLRGEWVVQLNKEGIKELVM